MSFSDTWVVDRTLFEYFHQGSCSCCGAGHALLMDSALLRQLCSDMDTDDARKQTAETCPWPTCMKEALHKDMVAVRAKLKARLPYYQEAPWRVLDLTVDTGAAGRTGSTGSRTSTGETGSTYDTGSGLARMKPAAPVNPILPVTPCAIDSTSSSSNMDSTGVTGSTAATAETGSMSETGSSPARSTRGTRRSCAGHAAGTMDFKGFSSNMDSTGFTGSRTLRARLNPRATLPGSSLARRACGTRRSCAGHAVRGARGIDEYSVFVATQSVRVMPIEEVLITYKITLDVKRAYSVLVASVLEQVKRFRETDLPCDGPTACEREFEKALETKKGAFVIQNPNYFETAAFMDMVLQVGGASLLPKRSKPDDAGGCQASETLSDRRLMRLLIFRYFLDRAIRRVLNASNETMNKQE